MRKTCTIAVLLLLFSLSFVACNTNGKRVHKATHVEKKESSQNEEKANLGKKDNSESKEEANDISSNNYEVRESDYSKSDNMLKCDIKYPQLSGLSDSKKQTEINSILKDEALKVLKYYDGALGSVELNINYEIALKNSNLLSIKYFGSGFVSNAAHPNSLFYTTNINMASGTRLRLKDIVNIDDDLVNKFLNGDFKALATYHNDVPKQYTNEEIKNYFMEADSLDNIGTNKQSDVFSYFTKDSLGISVGVGHALGDHAEFEIKYQDIKCKWNP